MPTSKDHKSGSGISRRGFLKGVGAGSVATGLLKTGMPGRPAAAQTQDVVGPGETPITLRVNGQTRKLRVEPRVTLLDALRNRMDLTGSKKVCDRGTCGACTVLIDGRPVYACSVLAVEAQNCEITTIEGLGAPERLSGIQEAFVEHDGLQCGFCTPGFVVACTAFLEKHPNPTLEDVREGLGGNLCRCGAYIGISQAVLDAAKAVKGGV